MKNQWNRTFGKLLSQRGMKEMFLCLLAFSMTITLGTLPIFDSEISIDIDHKAFRLMECESLTDIKGNEVKAAAECVFGGYYPLEPVTNL